MSHMSQNGQPRPDPKHCFQFHKKWLILIPFKEKNIYNLRTRLA